MNTEDAKKLGQELDSKIRIGKKGITKGLVQEINKHLEDKVILKIKVLRNNPIQDIEETAAVLQEGTKGIVVEIKGKTILMVDREELTD